MVKKNNYTRIAVFLLLLLLFTKGRHESVGFLEIKCRPISKREMYGKSVLILWTFGGHFICDRNVALTI
jgi:hypothetical protein